MKRTNINLEEDQISYLKELSIVEGMSVSAVIRGLIDSERFGPLKDLDGDPIYDIVGMFRSDKSTDSSKIDDDLYSTEGPL